MMAAEIEFGDINKENETISTAQAGKVGSVLFCILWINGGEKKNLGIVQFSLKVGNYMNKIRWLKILAGELSSVAQTDGGAPATSE